MLKIIHTGRAYEVLDLASPVHCLTERNIFWRFWQQGIELEETCREAGNLKALLRDAQLELLVTKVELESCQQNTLATYESQGPR